MNHIDVAVAREEITFITFPGTYHQFSHISSSGNPFIESDKIIHCADDHISGGLWSVSVYTIVSRPHHYHSNKAIERWGLFETPTKCEQVLVDVLFLKPKQISLEFRRCGHILQYAGLRLYRV